MLVYTQLPWCLLQLLTQLDGQQCLAILLRSSAVTLTTLTSSCPSDIYADYEIHCGTTIGDVLEIASYTSAATFNNNAIELWQTQATNHNWESCYAPIKSPNTCRLGSFSILVQKITTHNKEQNQKSNQFSLQYKEKKLSRLLRTYQEVWKPRNSKDKKTQPQKNISHANHLIYSKMQQNFIIHHKWEITTAATGLSIHHRDL